MEDLAHSPPDNTELRDDLREGFLQGSSEAGVYDLAAQGMLGDGVLAGPGGFQSGWLRQGPHMAGAPPNPAELATVDPRTHFPSAMPPRAAELAVGGPEVAAADSAIVTCLQAAIEALALAGRARAQLAQQAQHAQLAQHSAPGRGGACLAAGPGGAEQAEQMQQGSRYQGDPPRQEQQQEQQQEGISVRQGVTPVTPRQLGPVSQPPMHHQEQQQALREAGQPQLVISQQLQAWQEAGQGVHIWQREQQQQQVGEQVGPRLRPRRGAVPMVSVQDQAAAAAAATTAAVATGEADGSLAMGGSALGGSKQRQHPTPPPSTNKRKRTPRTGSSSAAAAAAASAAAAVGGGSGGDTPAPISPLPAKAASLTPVRHAGKGLRQFSLKVCEVVELKGRTSYHQVADELVKHLQQQGGDEGGHEGSYDEKNIRRRVYDALNVLMAVGVIRKEKKEIVWGGWPQGLGANSSHALEAERARVAARVEQKASLLEGLVNQLCRLSSLALRNHDTPMTKLQQQREAGQPTPNPLQLPFMLIQAPGAANIDVAISEDSRVAQLNFHSCPFQIYDDESVLRMLGVGGAPQDLLQRFVAARSRPPDPPSLPSRLAGPGPGSSVAQGSPFTYMGGGGAGGGPHWAKGLTPGAASGKGHIGMYPRLTPLPAVAAAAATARAQVAPPPTAAAATTAAAAAAAAAQRAPDGILHPLAGMGVHAGGSHSVGPVVWGGEAAAAGQSPQLILQEGLEALLHSSLQWPQQWCWPQELPAAPPPPQHDFQNEPAQQQGQAYQAAQQVQWQQQQQQLHNQPCQRNTVHQLHHHHLHQQKQQHQQQQWEEGSQNQGAWRDVDVHAFQSACTDGMLAPALDLGGWEGLLPFTR